MQTSDLYHTQGIRGFGAKATAYAAGVSNVHLELAAGTRLRCPCGCQDVEIYEHGQRSLVGLPCGRAKVRFWVPIYRIDHCPRCGRCPRVSLPFVDRYARYTRAVARGVIELRREMSIRAVAEFYGLDWRTVKEIEKSHLQTTYRRIRLREVRILGIDEIHVGQAGFKTIVRDLQSGAVLFVGKGRGAEALKPFEGRLNASRARIEVVAMDMAAGYVQWVRSAKALQHAEIVFDHFHLIKLMNDKLNKLRQQTMRHLDDETKKELKKKRHLFLRNEEDLEADDREELQRINGIFTDLATVHAMKEQLRAVYRTAKTATDAALLLHSWIGAATASGIACLNSMATTIKQHREGLLAYWKFDRLTSAAMEGFNNKIRWLIRQAYGFHDQEYFDLKIYDLPACKTVREL